MDDAKTNNYIICGVLLPGCDFVDQMVSGVIDSENKGFLECPSGDITSKLFVARFDTSDNTWSY
jgi:hypothetical protein